MSDFSTFSQMTGMRSEYFWRWVEQKSQFDDDGGVWIEIDGQRKVLTMRSASALRFSKGCSSLNLDRMADDVLMVLFTRVGFDCL
jgi:hypothetical protein